MKAPTTTARETTQAKAAAIELQITVKWGEDILAARRLKGEGEALIGAAPDAIAAVPCEALGQEVFLLARLFRGKALVCVPEGCVASWRAEEARAGEDGAAVIASARLVAGPAEIALGAGEEVTLWIGGFCLTVAGVRAERRPWAGGAWRRSAGALPHVALAAALHAVVAGLASQAASAAELTGEADAATAEELRGFLAAAERRAEAADPTVSIPSYTGDGKPTNGPSGNGKAGGGARAAGEEGAMGARLSRASAPRRFALPRQAEKEAALADARGLAAEAQDFGVIGLLAAGREHATAAAFGAQAARGMDAIAADGSMWARALGEHGGAEGLGLTGVGEGGGGSGLGVGLNHVGTIGHTFGQPGLGTGGDGGPQAIGFGISGGWGSCGGCGLRTTHRTKAPVVRWGDGISVSGRLPPEAIRRIVRQNFGRFRGCYASGLVANPALAGRVTARFVIARDGAVAVAQDGGSDLPDRAVVSCVIRAFYGLSFPQPEGGIVTVAYPIVFSPE